MYRLTALSLKQRSVVILATVLVALMGVFGMTQLKSELLPDINIPVLTVITTYQGADPNAVDTAVSQPIAAQVEGLAGINSVQTQSSEGVSVVVAQFDYGTDMKEREQQLLTAISGVQLPAGTGQPEITRISFDQFAFMQFSLTGADGDLATLRNIAQTQFVPALEGVDGISQVEVTGGADNLLLIQLDPAKLAANNLTAAQVAQSLQSNNLSVPTGAISADGVTLPVRVTSQPTSIDQINALVVSTGDSGTPVTIADLGTVTLGPGGSPGVARTNGEPSVAISLYLRQGANTVDTAAAAKDEIDRISAELASSNQNVTVTMIQNDADYINDSISSLIREALLGAGFAIIVIFVFLLSVRSTIVTAISIPTSVLVAFILLWTQGISLNIMTLGGLAVAVGRVVDDAIVVLEAIYRHVQKGERPRDAALKGTKEVAMAITASTITTVAVFLPLGFVGGIIGEIFRPFALTVSFALLASLLVALTVVPVLGSYLISKNKIRPPKPGNTRLQSIYEPFIRTAVRRPKTTILIAAVLLVASFALVPLIGTSFLPAGGEKIVGVQIDMPAGTSQDATLSEATKLEQVVQDTAPVDLIQTQIGGEGLIAAFTGASSSRANMTVTLDHSANLNDVMDQMRTDLASSADPGAEITVSDMSGGFGGSSNQVSVIVRGNDYQQVSDVTGQLTEQIAAVNNLVNVKNDVVTSKPEVSVQVDSAKAAAAGVTSQQVAADVASALNGVPGGAVAIDGTSYQSVITAGTTTDSAALGALPVGPNKTPLAEIATISNTDGPVQIVRIDSDRAAIITGSITTDETGKVTSDVTKIVNDAKKSTPDGVTIEIGGVSQDQADAFTSMGIALLVAVALVYLVMVVSFGSLSTPFVILFSLPLALIGVLAALALSGKTLGLPALIGVLMLVGIVVTNAIVLLEYVIELRKQGKPLDEALIEGGKTRLRPILMTASATILALIPLALSGEGGAIIASDLAVVVIGGLFTSTLLTLLVVPAAYRVVAGWQDRRAKKSEEKERLAHEAELATPTGVGD
jgi:HAE1 family hydrophobic/amphiphilic exporter-1